MESLALLLILGGVILLGLYFKLRQTEHPNQFATETQAAQQTNESKQPFKNFEQSSEPDSPAVAKELENKDSRAFTQSPVNSESQDQHSEAEKPAAVARLAEKKLSPEKVNFFDQSAKPTPVRIAPPPSRLATRPKRNRIRPRKQRIYSYNQATPESPRTASSPVANWQAQGTLLLDHDRRLQSQNSHFSQLPSSFFQELKRVANGSLSFENNTFQIKCPNSVYQYALSDLDQILFQQSGIALVPLTSKQPIALFLTTDALEIKQFVKQNLELQSQN